MSKTWVEIDTGILKKNILAARKTLSVGTDLIFVVKSNAYGHGLLPVADTAWSCGVKFFAVANVDEGRILRDALPKAMIMVVGFVDENEVREAMRSNLIVMLVNEEHVLRLEKVARAIRSKLKCHIKIDTGMGRLGVPWWEVADLAKKIRKTKGIEICGICSHFACSDSHQKAFSELQVRRFQEAERGIEENGIKILYKHISNSGGVLQNKLWDMDGVRIGIMLYGYPSADLSVREIRVRPFLQWKTRIVQIKDVPTGFSVSYGRTFVTKRSTRLATIDVGYADGYFRSLSNNGYVLIKGAKCPIRGRVTMNMIVVELNRKVGKISGDEEVVLIGRQGEEEIGADDLARWAKTIPYEILTSIRTGDRRII